MFRGRGGLCGAAWLPGAITINRFAGFGIGQRLGGGSLRGCGLLESLGLTAQQHTGNRGGDQGGHQHAEARLSGKFRVLVRQRSDKEGHSKTNAAGDGSGNHVTYAQPLGHLEPAHMRGQPCGGDDTQRFADYQSHNQCNDQRRDQQ